MRRLQRQHDDRRARPPAFPRAARCQQQFPLAALMALGALKSAGGQRAGPHGRQGRQPASLGREPLAAAPGARLRARLNVIASTAAPTAAPVSAPALTTLFPPSPGLDAGSICVSDLHTVYYESERDLRAALGRTAAGSVRGGARRRPPPPLRAVWQRSSGVCTLRSPVHPRYKPLTPSSFPFPLPQSTATPLARPRCSSTAAPAPAAGPTTRASSTRPITR